MCRHTRHSFIEIQSMTLHTKCVKLGQGVVLLFMHKYLSFTISSSCLSLREFKAKTEESNSLPHPQEWKHVIKIRCFQTPGTKSQAPPSLFSGSKSLSFPPSSGTSKKQHLPPFPPSAPSALAAGPYSTSLAFPTATQH